jgi:hypothetical protein
MHVGQPRPVIPVRSSTEHSTREYLYYELDAGGDPTDSACVPPITLLLGSRSEQENVHNDARCADR